MHKAEILKRRHALFCRLRQFFDEGAFIEVHTPLLVANPGLEPHLQYFETEFRPDLGGGKRQRFFLPTSPEYHLKKALALGLPRLYEITRSFRNGERSPEHEPEFFMLEWYRAPGTYREIADDFSALLTTLAENFAAAADRKLWSKRQDLTVREAFKLYAGLDLDAALEGRDSLTQQALRQKIGSVKGEEDFDECFHKVLVDRIEPRLGFEGPLFLWDYPRSQAALARLRSDNPRYCERFEVYWRGLELANAFGELTDPVEQRRRCLEDRARRHELYPQEECPPLDEDFLEALERLPSEVGGIAVGLDRLVQALFGCARVQDVIAFPHSHSL